VKAIDINETALTYVLDGERGESESKLVGDVVNECIEIADNTQ